MRLQDLSWWEVIAVVLFRNHKPMRNAHIQADPLIAEYRLFKALEDENLASTISLHLTLHAVPGASGRSDRSDPPVFDKNKDGLWVLNDRGVETAARRHSQLRTDLPVDKPEDQGFQSCPRDDVTGYLEHWRDLDSVSGRLNTLIEAYRHVRHTAQMSAWRFAPGRKRAGSWEPMYCAFGATPFSGDDFFVLRCVEGEPGERAKKFAIGFCPDYGVQGSQDVNDGATKRRGDIRAHLKRLMESTPVAPLGADYPKHPPGRVHAFKGFEVKVPDPGDGRALAEQFASIVTAWERLFCNAPSVQYPRPWERHEYLALLGVLSQQTEQMDQDSPHVGDLAAVLRRHPDEVVKELDLVHHLSQGAQVAPTASALQQIWTEVAVDGKVDVIRLGRALPNPQSCDSAEPPSRYAVTTLRVARDTALSASVKRLYGYECQVCGTRIPLGPGSWYAEVHHVKPLGDPHRGPDTVDNMLCLCPNHHAEFDLGVIALDPMTLRVLHLDPNNEYTGREVMLQPGHLISRENVSHHFEHVYRGRR